MLSFFPVMAESTKKLFDPAMEHNRLSRFARKLGKDTCDLMIENCVESFNARECLIHSDSHVFNILVERKPDINTLEQFGPVGKYVLCDWEMSMAGPLGRDIGLTHAFPIACIIAHAFNGHTGVSYCILDVLELLWSEYASALKAEGQKDEDCLRKTYRACIGWIGHFLYGVYYELGVHLEFLPLEDNVISAESVKESLGYLGLQFMRIGFGEYEVDASLDSLRSMFRAAIEEEVEHKLAVTKPRRNRRSSMLRVSGRRVSDAALFASFTSKMHVACLAKVEG